MLDEAGVAKLQEFGVDDDDIERDADRPGQPVVRISLWRRKVTDSDLVFLSDFREVRSISFRFTQVTDGVLKYLRDWRHLEHLDCGFARVTGHGISCLHATCPLKSLLLCGDAFDPAATSLLASRLGIQYLQLMKTRLADAHLAPLVILPRLTDLLLNETGISDEGLATLGQIRTLRSLWLNGTLISDAGLRDLAQLDHLEELEIAHCPKITNKGLEYLVGLPAIQKITAHGTAVTRAGALRLRKMFPPAIRNKLQIVTY